MLAHALDRKSRTLRADGYLRQFKYRVPLHSVASCQFIRSGPVDQVVVLHVIYSSGYSFTFLLVTEIPDLVIGGVSPSFIHHPSPAILHPFHQSSFNNSASFYPMNIFSLFLPGVHMCLVDIKIIGRNRDV